MFLRIRGLTLPWYKIYRTNDPCRWHFLLLRFPEKPSRCFHQQRLFSTAPASAKHDATTTSEEAAASSASGSQNRERSRDERRKEKDDDLGGDEDHQTREKQEYYRASAEDRTALVKMNFYFEDIPKPDKSKETFQNALGLFLQRNVHRRGHVEFIYAALKQMREFGVHKDLATYKMLINIFPKGGKMIPETMLQAELFHFPKQNYCCIDVLDQLEYNGVRPDKELFHMVKNVFGDASHAMRKMKRIMYWSSRRAHINPYPVPYVLPSASIEVAKIAIKRMCRDPATEVNVWLTQEIFPEGETTWIVSGQAPLQMQHIERHNRDEAIYVDGPFRVWVGDQTITYFSLVAEAAVGKEYSNFRPWKYYSADEWSKWETKHNREFPESRKALMTRPTMHQQEDGTILALCATGNSSKDSLISWTVFLEQANPLLKKIPIIFRLRTLRADLMCPDNFDQRNKTDQPVVWKIAPRTVPSGETAFEQPQESSQLIDTKKQAPTLSSPE